MNCKARPGGSVESDPKPTSRRATAGSLAMVRHFLVDHLVGAGEQREWDIKTKRPRRWLIDDEFKVCR
jgi:hypothetical protein